MLSLIIVVLCRRIRTLYVELKANNVQSGIGLEVNSPGETGTLLDGEDFQLDGEATPGQQP